MQKYLVLIRISVSLTFTRAVDMLVIGREERESVVIDTSDGPVTVTLCRGGTSPRLGITAPKKCKIRRKELEDGEESGKPVSKEEGSSGN